MTQPIDKKSLENLPIPVAESSSPIVEVGVDPALKALLAETAPDAPEQARIRKAVDIAVKKGILREEVFSSERPGARHAYILSSVHEMSPSRDPNSVPKEIRRSQIELFQFLHLLQKESATSPVLIEGWSSTERATRFNPEPPFVKIGGKSVSLFSKEAQEYYYQNPQKLTYLMEEHQRQYGIVTSFYGYSPYPNRGAYSPALEEERRPYQERRQKALGFRGGCQFIFNEIASKGTIDIHAITIRGMRYIQIASQQMLLQEFIDGVRGYLQNFEESVIDAAKREDCFAEGLRATPSQEVPLLWNGLRHTLPLAERLRTDTQVHVLTPQASVAFDSLRTSGTDLQERRASMDIDFFETLLAHAQSLV